MGDQEDEGAAPVGGKLFELSMTGEPNGGGPNAWRASPGRVSALKRWNNSAARRGFQRRNVMQQHIVCECARVEWCPGPSGSESWRIARLCLKLQKARRLALPSNPRQLVDVASLPTHPADSDKKGFIAFYRGLPKNDQVRRRPASAAPQTSADGF